MGFPPVGLRPPSVKPKRTYQRTSLVKLLQLAIAICEYISFDFYFTIELFDSENSFAPSDTFIFSDVYAGSSSMFENSINSPPSGGGVKVGSITTYKYINNYRRIYKGTVSFKNTYGNFGTLRIYFPCKNFEIWPLEDSVALFNLEFNSVENYVLTPNNSIPADVPQYSNPEDTIGADIENYKDAEESVANTPNDIKDKYEQETGKELEDYSSVFGNIYTDILAFLPAFAVISHLFDYLLVGSIFMSIVRIALCLGLFAFVLNIITSIVSRHDRKERERNNKNVKSRKGR